MPYLALSYGPREGTDGNLRGYTDPVYGDCLDTRTSTAKEYYPSSSLYAPSLGVPYQSSAETLTTDDTPSSSPESQQGTDAPHPGPTDTRHVMKPAAVPTAMESPVSCPVQAPSFRSVHQILPQHAVASAVKGLACAASGRWVIHVCFGTIVTLSTAESENIGESNAAKETI